MLCLFFPFSKLKLCCHSHFRKQRYRLKMWLHLMVLSKSGVFDKHHLAATYTFNSYGSRTSTGRCVLLFTGQTADKMKGCTKAWQKKGNGKVKTKWN